MVDHFCLLVFYLIFSLPLFLILPASLISNAIALALLVDVVFKLTLYATRKSLADIAVAPLLEICSSYFFGP